MNEKGELMRSHKGEATKAAKKEAAHQKKAHVDAKASQKPEFEFNEADADDVALDELEAMTIASALLKKHFSPPAKVPCRWGPWQDGICSKTCGDGIQQKTRTKTQEKKHGGASCPGGSSESAPCNKGECPPPPTPAPTPAPTLPPSFVTRMGDVSVLTVLVTSIVAAFNAF